MTGRIAMPPVAEDRSCRSLPLQAVSRLLDTLDKPLMVADRGGSLLLVNTRARRCLEFQGFKETDDPNLFSDLLKLDAAGIFRQVENGEHEVSVQMGAAEKKIAARIQWIPECDWLVVKWKTGQMGTPAPIPELSLRCKSCCRNVKSLTGICLLPI